MQIQFQTKEKPFQKMFSDELDMVQVSALGVILSTSVCSEARTIYLFWNLFYVNVFDDGKILYVQRIESVRMVKSISFDY